MNDRSIKTSRFHGTLKRLAELTEDHNLKIFSDETGAADAGKISY